MPDLIGRNLNSKIPNSQGLGSFSLDSMTNPKKQINHFRAHFANLSKAVVFVSNVECTSKKLLSLCLRDRVGTFSGLTVLASQKWWFLDATVGGI